jgi:hypothetical protein
MKSLGTVGALNLDGGNSTAMYLKDEGVMNKPPDGGERVVANHIGVCKEPRSMHSTWIWLRREDRLSKSEADVAADRARRAQHEQR